MNQYIITEEQLNRMRRCISVDEAGKILDDVYSHPYQNRTCPKCKEIFELMLIEQEGVKTEA
jgi:phage FluMu protein Com